MFRPEMERRHQSRVSLWCCLLTHLTNIFIKSSPQGIANYGMREVCNSVGFQLKSTYAGCTSASKCPSNLNAVAIQGWYGGILREVTHHPAQLKFDLITNRHTYAGANQQAVTGLPVHTYPVSFFYPSNETSSTFYLLH